jgi:hypothetical protein
MATKGAIERSHNTVEMYESGEKTFKIWPKQHNNHSNDLEEDIDTNSSASWENNSFENETISP